MQQQAAEVHYLKGNPSKRPPKKVVKASPGCPVPPDWLGNEANAEWARVTPELDRLGLLATIDRAILALYCDAWEKWLEAREALGDQLVVKGSNTAKDARVKNPAWQVYREAGDKVAAYAKELALTPKARLGMHPAEQTVDDGADLLG